MKSRDEEARELALRRAAAEQQMWTRMEERGMTREGGWRIAESTRDTRGGTELVLRPMHVWHESPYDMEHVYFVKASDAVESSVTPEPLRRDRASP